MLDSKRSACALHPADSSRIEARRPSKEDTLLARHSANLCALATPPIFRAHRPSRSINREQNRLGIHQCVHIWTIASTSNPILANMKFLIFAALAVVALASDKPYYPKAPYYPKPAYPSPSYYPKPAYPSYSPPEYPKPAYPSYSAPEYPKPTYPAPYAKSYDYPPMPYTFDWAVLDEPSYNDFGHKETSDGKVVDGIYYVVLPDSRKQVVTYKADDYGYVADVKYEGEAKYDEYKTAYKPAYKPAYAPPAYPKAAYSPPAYPKAYPEPSYSSYPKPTYPSYPAPAYPSYPKPSYPSYPRPAYPSYPRPAYPSYPKPSYPAQTTTEAATEAPVPVAKVEEVVVAEVAVAAEPVVDVAAAEPVAEVAAAEPVVEVAAAEPVVEAVEINTEAAAAAVVETTAEPEDATTVA